MESVAIDPSNVNNLEKELFNVALGFIDFANLTAYEQYREKLASDPGATETLRRVEAAGCILSEERAFVRRVPG